MITNTPFSYNYTIYQGSTFEKVFTLKKKYSYKFTVNAGETSLSGTDDYGNSFTYDSSTDEVNVYVNNVYLSKRDYTLVEPGTITYAALVEDDIVEVEKYTILDLTTVSSMRSNIRKSVATPVILNLTTANGNFTVNASAGQFTMKITDEETESITSGLTFVYDVEAVESNGDVSKLLAGEVTFEKESTYE